MERTCLAREREDYDASIAADRDSISRYSYTSSTTSEEKEKKEGLGGGGGGWLEMKSSELMEMGLFVYERVGRWPLPVRWRKQGRRVGYIAGANVFVNDIIHRHSTKRERERESFRRNDDRETHDYRGQLVMKNTEKKTRGKIALLSPLFLFHF